MVRARHTDVVRAAQPQHTTVRNAAAVVRPLARLLPWEEGRRKIPDTTNRGQTLIREGDELCASGAWHGHGTAAGRRNCGAGDAGGGRGLRPAGRAVHLRGLGRRPLGPDAVGG